MRNIHGRFRIVKYQSAQDKFYVVEVNMRGEQWEEPRIRHLEDRRLTFSSPQEAASFIQALDLHRGGYVAEDLVENMLVR